MSAALLLRGVSSSAGLPWDRPWSVDYRVCLESHWRCLIEPLAERFGGCRVYLATYETPALSQLVRDYDPDGIVLPNFHGSNQRDTAIVGMEKVADENSWCDFDLVVVSRFDAEYLSSPLDLDFNYNAVNFPWRELESGWADHRRTGDCFHVVGRFMLDGFMKGVQDCPHTQCLHMIWDHVSKFARCKWLLDEFGDSNTDVKPNPVYKLRRMPK